MTQPLVTIAIPTYRRPELLRRALTCVTKQEYENLEVLVADNGTPGHLVQDVVDSFKGEIKNLTFKKRPENIGALNNFFGLLDIANGKYFMWLADDDEISTNYVSSLVALLEKNPDASSAAGNWFLMSDEVNGKLMPTSNYPQKSALVRTIRFVWKSDDAFFYGLHRTAAIRKATFPGYWWPNKDVILNWGYVYLFDMVLSGRILITDDCTVQFINHDYTSKKYGVNMSKKLEVFQYIVRRFNVHYLFLLKICKSQNPIAIFPIICISVAVLCREFCSFFYYILFRKVTRRIESGECVGWKE